MPELETYYGPTAWDSDPGKQWHYGCDGEVWYLEDGLICRKCEAQQDFPEEEK